MDFQDQNTSYSPVNTVGGGAPFVPAPQSPTYNAQHVQTDGDVTAVPQEQIGFNAAEMIPQPADRLSAPAEVFADSAPLVSTPVVNSVPTFAPPDVPEAVIPASPASTSPVQTTAEPSPLTLPAVETDSETPPADAAPLPSESVPSQDGSQEKTPLEILEEILASANEGSAVPSEAGAVPDVPSAEAQRAQAEKEAQETAARAAEEERYRQEAESRIALAQQDLQQAAQQRVEVTKELASQGKQVGPTIAVPQDDQFTIGQLQHDTLNQNTH